MMVTIGISSSAYAVRDGDVSHHEEELHERDLTELREFINTKRAFDLQEKSKNLTISGDMRTEWRHLFESGCNGKQLRGRGRKDCICIPLSHNDFDIEFNLRFDYEYERAWAAAHIQFDNSAGIDRLDCLCTSFDCEDSEENCTAAFDAEPGCTKDRFHGHGTFDFLNLKRAYFGYTIFKDCGTLDIEVGRHMLYDVFESEIEFDNRMDGILLQYSNKMEHFANWYIKIAGFVVDERVNQFAWATEIGFFNIYDTGFDVKYSFIDWRKRGHDRCGFHDPAACKYAISQVILNYNVNPDYFCMPAQIYAAGLVNHLARQAPQGKIFGNQRWGWYAGFAMGEVEYEGDWSFYIEYQYVQRNAIAFDEQSGIGLGNVIGDCCNRFPAIGFKGWRFESLYAITDNLTFELIIDYAKSNEPETKVIKKRRIVDDEEVVRKFRVKDGHHNRHHTYSKVELEAVYAF